MAQNNKHITSDDMDFMENDINNDDSTTRDTTYRDDEDKPVWTKRLRKADKGVKKLHVDIGIEYGNRLDDALNRLNEKYKSEDNSKSKKTRYVSETDIIEELIDKHLWRILDENGLIK